MCWGSCAGAEALAEAEHLGKEGAAAGTYQELPFEGGESLARKHLFLIPYPNADPLLTPSWSWSLLITLGRELRPVGFEQFRGSMWHRKTESAPIPEKQLTSNGERFQSWDCISPTHPPWPSPL